MDNEEIPEGYIETLSNADLLEWYMNCSQLSVRYSDELGNYGNDEDKKLTYEDRTIIIGAEILKRMN